MHDVGGKGYVHGELHEYMYMMMMLVMMMFIENFKTMYLML